MKRIFILLLCALLLAGCGGKTGESGAAANTTDTVSSTAGDGAGDGEGESETETETEHFLETLMEIQLNRLQVLFLRGLKAIVMAYSLQAFICRVTSYHMSR